MQCRKAVLMSAAGAAVSKPTSQQIDLRKTSIAVRADLACKRAMSAYLLQALHQLLLLCTLGCHARCCLNSCRESCCWHIRAARQGTTVAGEVVRDACSGAADAEARPLVHNACSSRCRDGPKPCYHVRGTAADPTRCHSTESRGEMACLLH